MATLLFAMSSSNPTLPKSLPSSSTIRRIKRSSHVAQARRTGISSRTKKLEKRTKKKDGASTNEEEEGEILEEYSVEYGGPEIEYSKEPMPKLEGLEPDFWEGEQWNAFGFFIQYLWAFGILFGLVSGGIAVATYNEGASDFKKTPAYQESIQSRELLEEPDASTADVFESNPTETAPSLE